MNEVLIQFGKTITGRFKNPFIFTYTIVVIAKNWEIIYTFFTLNSQFNLDYRISVITQKLSPTFKIFIFEVLENIGISLLVIVVTFSLLLLTEIVSSLFYNWTLGVRNKFKSKSVVSKEEFDFLDLEKNQMEIDLKDSKLYIASLSQRITTLENQLKNEEKTIEDIENEDSSSNEESISEVDKRKEDEDLETKRKVFKIYTSLRKKKMIDEFKKTSINIKKGYGISPDSEPTTLFLDLNLIEFVKKDIDNRFPTSTSRYYDYYYKITSLGHKVIDLINDQEESSGSGS